MKKFLFDILSNPDSTTYSSKRVGGFISLFATIAFGCFNLIQPMTIIAGLVIAFFGLASIDYKEFLKKDNTTVAVSTPSDQGISVSIPDTSKSEI